MPLYRPNIYYLIICIESIITQYHNTLELCIYADGMPSKNVLGLLNAYTNLDSRIRFSIGDEHSHISKASNMALSMTNGKYIAFIDQDDFLLHIP